VQHVEETTHNVDHLRKPVLVYRVYYLNALDLEQEFGQTEYRTSIPQLLVHFEVPVHLLRVPRLIIPGHHLLRILYQLCQFVPSLVG
jgi:hypothetical protein